jgi:hypothetical protein
MNLGTSTSINLLDDGGVSRSPKTLDLRFKVPHTALNLLALRMVIKYQKEAMNGN